MIHRNIMPPPTKEFRYSFRCPKYWLEICSMASTSPFSNMATLVLSSSTSMKCRFWVGKELALSQ